VEKKKKSKKKEVKTDMLGGISKQSENPWSQSLRKEGYTVGRICRK